MRFGTFLRGSSAPRKATYGWPCSPHLMAALRISSSLGGWNCARSTPW
ncbi:hypothetical protein [Nonomuraea rubra]